jgi:peptidoglycan/LPS O-acetylase OafA/YrhL
MPEEFWPGLWRVLVPTLTLAAASWLLVERPALRWSARVTRGRRARPRVQAVGETG